MVTINPCIDYVKSSENYTSFNKFQYYFERSIREWSGTKEVPFEESSIREFDLHVMSDDGLQEVQEGVSMTLFLLDRGVLMKRARMIGNRGRTRFLQRFVRSLLVLLEFVGGGGRHNLKVREVTLRTMTGQLIDCSCKLGQQQ